MTYVVNGRQLQRNKITISDLTAISFRLIVHPVFCFFTEVHVHTEHFFCLCWCPWLNLQEQRISFKSSRDLALADPPSLLEPLMVVSKGSFPSQRTSDPEAEGFQSADYKDSSLVGSEAKSQSTETLELRMTSPLSNQRCKFPSGPRLLSPRPQ